MNKWEYKKLWFGLRGLEMSDFENVLNKFGDEGWRVICVTELGQGTRVILERQK